uniref:Uncharacterized protein n=1 Tax=Medicago truncatula TaxID=3880 RepID=A2Q253_MEDTR|nr:hypothetical protein MtrDRAFT_AC149208g47v2 [Medicago truncatula]
MVTVLMGYRHLKLRKIRYGMILKVEIEGQPMTRSDKKVKVGLRDRCCGVFGLG